MIYYESVYKFCICICSCCFWFKLDCTSCTVHFGDEAVKTSNIYKTSSTNIHISHNFIVLSGLCCTSCYSKRTNRKFVAIDVNCTACTGNSICFTRSYVCSVILIICTVNFHWVIYTGYTIRTSSLKVEYSLIKTTLFFYNFSCKGELSTVRVLNKM